MVEEVKAMAAMSSDGAAYQASPGQPCPVRLSRASGMISRKEVANKATQRGEMITCRGRKPRKDAEGHANAEPYYYFTMRFRIRVALRSLKTTAGDCAGLRNVGRRLLILGDRILGSSPRTTSVWGCLSQKHRFSPLHCLLWHTSPSSSSGLTRGSNHRRQARRTAKTRNPAPKGTGLLFPAWEAE